MFKYIFNMKLFFLTLSLYTCLNLTLKAQKADGLVKWVTFKEAQESLKTNPKPLLIDVYTNWCGWCKHMINTTYSDPNIAAYINANFYPIKFNAETKDSIMYNGKLYKTTSPASNATHELAIKLIGNNLSYPSTFFSADNFEVNLLSQGYLDIAKFTPLLTFFSEKTYKYVNVNEYSQAYNRAFVDTNFVKKHIKYYTLPEIEKLQQTKPKKILLNLFANFNMASKVQSLTTLKDTAIVNYLNKNYYVLNLNVESNDTIIFKNEKHFKVNNGQISLHSLAYKICNGTLQFPSLVVLDELYNTIGVLNVYFAPSNLLPAISFYGSNAYKQKSWQDYIVEYHKIK